jgi:hypothetical protein
VSDDDGQTTYDPSPNEIHRFAEQVKAAVRAGVSDQWPPETRLRLGLTRDVVARIRASADEYDVLGEDGRPWLWFRTDAPAPPGYVPVELWNALHPRDRQDAPRDDGA